MATLADPFNFDQLAGQALRLINLAHQAYAREAMHEPVIAAFRGELDGADQERLEVLRGRSRGDTREDIALVASLFLRSILRRNQALGAACLQAAEALAAETDEPEGSEAGEHAAS